MLLAGHLLLTDAPRNEARPGHTRLATGTVRLDGEQIAEVIECPPEAFPKTIDAGGADTLICPGFIDTHLHLPQFDIVGAHGRPLLDWLDEFTFPAERKWEDADYARGMTRRVVDQLLAHGTTGICAYSTVHYDATRAALETARDAGMRGVIGQSIIERNAPEDFVRPATRLLDESQQLLQDFPPAGRLAAAVTPRFAVTCSAELMADLGKLADERSAVIQSHLAETEAECRLVAELFDGKPYVDVYKNAGLLTPRSIYGHGIYLDAASQGTLAESSAIIAHCPTANSFLRSGTMDRRSHRDASVRLTLGSDIGAGYERSMVRVGRAMIEAAASLTSDEANRLPTAAEAWWQITTGNAEALGWSDAGELRPGVSADLVVVQPDIPWQISGLDHGVDPLARLMWAWDDRWVERTIVRGRSVFPKR
ncbi:MAG: amidohydrolase family protein [Planctomycetota bacterium]